MENIIFLIIIPMVVTVPVTAVLCRIRISCKLPVSFGTVMLSAFLVTFLWLGFVTDWEIYTIGFWHGFSPKPPDRPLMLKVVASTFIMCHLSALGIVHVYQRRTKKDDHAAAKLISK
jgi:hypothetical protein